MTRSHTDGPVSQHSLGVRQTPLQGPELCCSNLGALDVSLDTCSALERCTDFCQVGGRVKGLRTS